jgi:xylulokinase
MLVSDERKEVMSETKKYLGIDIGTTSIKAAVFAKDGKRLALRSVDYTLDTDPVTGFIEFNADEYVNMCKNIISELISECGKIDALSVDTQGETLILTDEQGTPLYPAVVWLDNRASNEAEEIKERFGNKCVYEFTGQPEITAGWPASKILWMKNNRPEIFKNVKKIFMLEDYIIYRLSGAFVTEPTIQSSTIYYDITRGEWWKEMLDFIETTGMIIDFDRNYLMRNRDKKHIQRLYELALKFKEKNLLAK